MKKKIAKKVILFVRVSEKAITKMERAMRRQGCRSRAKFINAYLEVCEVFDMSKAK